MCSAMDTKEGGSQRASWSACSSQSSPSPSHACEGGGVEGAGTVGNQGSFCKRSAVVQRFREGLAEQMHATGVRGRSRTRTSLVGAYVDEHGQSTKHNQCVEGSIKPRATPSLLVYAIPPVCMVALRH